jgi:hypothetical protein
MSEQQMEADLAKKLSSQYWRINSLYPVENEKGKVVIFRLNPVQRILYKNLWWLNVIPKSRQHGISTFFEKLWFDTSLFNPNMNCGIVDKSMPDATKKLAKMKFAWENMDDPEICPKTYQIGAMIKERTKIIKSNDSEIELSNGSKIWCGVSLRGTAIQRLHVSELGPISYNNPERAEEIRAGAFNTVHEGSITAIESTHEGGEFGLNYEMIRLAQQSPPERERMNRMNWQLHFFGWWQDPKNTLEVDAGYDTAVTPELEELFMEKEQLCKMKLSKEQKYWYAMKRLTQRDKMSKEHPFDVEEAISAAIKGAIYGDLMNEMRSDGRITDFPWDVSSPLYCFWDMGKKDFMCMELMQHNGSYWTVLDSFAYFGKGEHFYHQKVLEWERKYGFISMHFMPWDAGKAGEEGPSWVNSFNKLGMTNIRTVPRSNDKWSGIRHARTLLPMMKIHAVNCDKEITVAEIKIPSLITSLRSYHVKVEEKDGRVNEVPVHGPESHHCDAIRTFAEAHSKGYLNQDYGLSNNGRGTPGNHQITVDKGGYDNPYGRQKVDYGANGGVRIRY